MRVILSAVLICLAVAGSSAQTVKTVRKDSTRQVVVVNGDTLRHINLKEVVIFPKTFKNRLQEKQYWRLVYNIKKVLPYSKIIAATVNQVEAKLDALPSERERKKYIKEMEDSLWKRYEADMRQMTTTQGELLFKLVDRETANTSYFWIESFRGSVSAFFWQGIARLFGTNLKSKYDPKGEDALIEQIVQYVERGLL